MLKRKRNKLVNEPAKESLQNLPRDLIQYTVAHAEGYYSSAATSVMATLSNSCHAIHTLFKPELNIRGAKQLIAYVLYPDEAAKRAILNIAKTNPGLFFIPIKEIIDHVKDLDGNHRVYENWSAYQLLFLGDVNLLECVKKDLDTYLDQNKSVGKNIHDHAFARNQVLEKFPNGFDFPPCTDEFKALLTALEKAITIDQQLRHTRTPSKETVDRVNKLREYFKQGVVKTGHPFNMNDIVKAHEAYDQNFRQWYGYQSKFFSVKVIGLLERFMTAPYLLKALQGLKNHEKPLKRSFRLTNHEFGCDLRTKDITVVPLDDSNPLYRLGDSVFIHSNTGRDFQFDNSLSANLHRLREASSAWKNIVKQTQQFYQNFCRTDKLSYGAQAI